MNPSVSLQVSATPIEVAQQMKSRAFRSRSQLFAVPNPEAHQGPRTSVRAAMTLGRSAGACTARSSESVYDSS